jgi:hypothetical protein
MIITGRPFMIRRVHIGATILAALTACIYPTHSCACTVFPPGAIVYGVVRTAADAPLAGVHVETRTARAPCTESVESSIYGNSETTAADGQYRIYAPATDPGATCVLVSASLGELRASATVTVQSKTPYNNTVFDSIRVDLRFP